MQVQPYLFFNGRCEEAAAFYGTAIGAETVMMMRFKEAPEGPPGLSPGHEDKVMHMALRIGDAMVLASDGMGSGDLAFKGFSLALTAPDKAKADQWFAALADGGKIDMPLGPTFFSPAFGVVTDRFGVSWMVLLDAEPAQT
jgi:PhnB protein